MNASVTLVVQLPVMPPLPCPECGDWLHLKASRFGLFYGCSRFPACRATHGAHPDGNPLGVPANKETKLARIAAHAAFDPLWEQIASSYEIRPMKSKSRRRNERHIKKRQRVRAYRWLAEQLQIGFDECHFGSFDIATCAKAEAFCKTTDSTAIREWAKARGH